MTIHGFYVYGTAGSISIGRAGQVWQEVCRRRQQCGNALRVSRRRGFKRARRSDFGRSQDRSQLEKECADRDTATQSLFRVRLRLPMNANDALFLPPATLPHPARCQRTKQFIPQQPGPNLGRCPPPSRTAALPLHRINPHNLNRPRTSQPSPLPHHYVLETRI